jgi:hypothetical protein
MSRYLFGPGSKDAERRDSISSKFQLAVDDAAYFDSPATLAKFLRSEYALTQQDRTMLADYVEGKLKRGRGRRGGRYIFRGDWLSEAANIYAVTMLRWRRMNGRRLKFACKDGRVVAIRPELCRRIATRLGYPHKAEMLKDYINRPKSRR